MVVSMAGCATVPSQSQKYEIPSLELYRPEAPVLEDVVLETTVPDSLLRNYAEITEYALALEDYAWGGEEFGGLEKYIDDLMDIFQE